MRATRPTLVVAAAATALSLAWASPATAEEHPERQPPFGGERPPALLEPGSAGERPAGFSISAAEAIEISAADETLLEEREQTPAAEPTAFVRGQRWQVSWIDPQGREVAQVIIDGANGVVEEAWRDFQVGSELARGYDGAVAACRKLRTLLGRDDITVRMPPSGFKDIREFLTKGGALA